MSGILYKDFPYLGGGGGTDVEANPTGTPTDELNTIRIGQDIYEIVGGGGGGGYEETTLFDTGATTNGEFSLSDDINNYDAITIYGTWSASNVNGEMPITISVKDFVSNFTYTSTPNTSTPHLFFHLYGSEYFRIARGSDDTKLYLFDNHSGKVARVCGIKFGGSEGGGNFEITDLWKNTTGGGNGTYTLSQSIDDFDAISIWFGIYSEHVGNPYISDHRIINVSELQEAHNAGIKFILTSYASRVIYVDFNGTTMTLSSQSGSQTVLQVKGIKY